MKPKPKPQRSFGVAFPNLDNILKLAQAYDGMTARVDERLRQIGIDPLTLSWRDVDYIIAYSQDPSKDEYAWVTADYIADLLSGAHYENEEGRKLQKDRTDMKKQLVQFLSETPDTSHYSGEQIEKLASVLLEYGVSIDDLRDLVETGEMYTSE